MTLPTVTYRPATEQDLASAVALMEELIKELGPQPAAEEILPKVRDDLKHAVGANNTQVFLAFDGDLCIGLSRADILESEPIFRLRTQTRCGYVDQMYVKPEYRRQGIGRRLLYECEQWFRERDIQHALLHAAPKAVQFYSREGYRPNREMFKQLG